MRFGRSVLSCDSPPIFLACSKLQTNPPAKRPSTLTAFARPSVPCWFRMGFRSLTWSGSRIKGRGRCGSRLNEKARLFRLIRAGVFRSTIARMSRVMRRRCSMPKTRLPIITASKCPRRGLIEGYVRLRISFVFEGRQRASSLLIQRRMGSVFAPRNDGERGLPQCLGAADPGCPRQGIERAGDDA